MENKNSGKKGFSVLGIIVGVAAVIFGIVVFVTNTYLPTPSDTSFGGDFYTYSYRATRYVSENLSSIGKMLKLALGFILITFGLTDIAYFGVKLNEKPVVVQTMCFDQTSSKNESLTEGETI